MYATERVIIERCFGMLKRRFPMLGYTMRVKLERVALFIIAGFVLHNVAKFLKDPDFVENLEESVNSNSSEQAETNLPATTIRARGQTKRKLITQQIYSGVYNVI